MRILCPKTAFCHHNEEVNKLGDDLRELYETIRVNVDEEEQWKVFDFAEDSFLEELEIGDYINDINSYHLHMFDKHDVTTKKLDVIVEKSRESGCKLRGTDRRVLQPAWRIREKI